MEVKKMGVEGRSGRNAGPVIFTNPRVTTGPRAKSHVDYRGPITWYTFAGDAQWSLTCPGSNQR